MTKPKKDTAWISGEELDELEAHGLHLLEPDPKDHLKLKEK